MALDSHLRALALLSSDPAADGLAIYRQLRRIEEVAHNAATAQCNGESYGGQPFRPDWDASGNEGTDTEWRQFLTGIAAKVADCFGGSLPSGFFFNGDARGYALKIEPEHVPAGMLMDWGRNGILAPTREAFH